MFVELFLLSQASSLKDEINPFRFPDFKRHHEVDINDFEWNITASIGYSGIKFAKDIQVPWREIIQIDIMNPLTVLLASSSGQNSNFLFFMNKYLQN